MRRRQLPPVGTLEELRTVAAAVPRDPAATRDCCARLLERTAVERREHAGEWLVFLAALGCVTDDGDGYYRLDSRPAVTELRDRFRSRVFGVREVVDLLGSADGSLTTTELTGGLDAETRRRLDRAGEPYLERLLGWAVVLGLVTRTGRGYRRPP